jgi:murein DD-endopeptidase MepM/ murein hydrolase activator NlpD
VGAGNGPLDSRRSELGTIAGAEIREEDPEARIIEVALIAKLGNTGPSEGPHLHFGLLDKPPIAGRSLPFVFDSFTLDGAVDFDASKGDRLVIRPDARLVRSAYPLYGGIQDYPQRGGRSLKRVKVRSGRASARIPLLLRWCCKSRPVGGRPSKMSNNRIRKGGFLNQNSLIRAQFRTTFLASGPKIVLQYYHFNTGHFGALTYRGFVPISEIAS